MIDKNWLKICSYEEIESFLEKNGSVYIENTATKINLKFIYLSNPKDLVIKVELLDRGNFEKIKDNIWMLDYTISNIPNFCYWIKETCFEGGKEIERIVKDKYCKNNLIIYNSFGKKVDIRQYVLPIIQPKNNNKLKNKKVLFNSIIYNDERKIVIVYPKKYNKLEINNKCLIVTDGNFWKDTMCLDSFLYKNLGCKFMSNLVICYIYQKNRQDELIMSEKFTKFLKNEVFKLLQKNNIVKSLNDLIYFGNSYGAVQGLFMLQQKIQFGGYICQSPSLWLDKENIIISYFKNLTKMGYENSSKIYFSYGIQEIDLITKKSKIMLDIIKNKPNTFVNIFNGTHDYFDWQRDLINALKVFKEEL